MLTPREKSLYRRLRVGLMVSFSPSSIHNVIILSILHSWCHSIYPLSTMSFIHPPFIIFPFHPFSIHNGMPSALYPHSHHSIYPLSMMSCHLPSIHKVIPSIHCPQCYHSVLYPWCHSIYLLSIMSFHPSSIHYFSFHPFSIHNIIPVLYP